ncbi:hypothetical protein CDEST_00986 [Colletotrichum destructivum]|uniref:Uncharacterized protein n=1 Tax=Colletotrichum destructivum TaxID=34406 RepID=A0AAX4HXQ5_9PEZI|nr:hypothetical protein CDEST_00986 [Colletotrichum destructivum]
MQKTISAGIVTDQPRQARTSLAAHPAMESPSAVSPSGNNGAACKMEKVYKTNKHVCMCHPMVAHPFYTLCME